MATHPRLVNKQFNSPIGLYSDRNVREVLDRESQLLANGVVGINFHDPHVGKPTNLQNSAVLRMLEEEEHRQRNGHSASDEFVPRSLRETIKWPPPEYEIKHRQRSSFRDVVTSGVRRVAWPPPPDAVDNYLEESSNQVQGGPQVTSPTPNKQAPPPKEHQPRVHHIPIQKAEPASPLKPLTISTGNNLQQNQYQSPISPVVNHSPSSFIRPSTPSKRWAPVNSPVPQIQSPHLYQSPLIQQQDQYNFVQQPVAQQYQPAAQLYQSPPLVAQPATAPPQVAPKPVQKFVEPPPSTIILRSQAPVSQASPPVFTSQPATATLNGGKNLRGDTKWPPETVKSQMEEENRQRIELARGPIFRPRRVQKDYSNFFAQHALNSTYPGYKVPPGTQYYRPS